MITDERNEIKAELIRMRKYIMHHGVPIGDCVAWNKLKKMFEIGICKEDDLAWLKTYEEGKEAK